MSIGFDIVIVCVSKFCCIVVVVPSSFFVVVVVVAPSCLVVDVERTFPSAVEVVETKSPFESLKVVVVGPFCLFSDV